MQSTRQRLQYRVDQEPVLGTSLAATVRRSSGYTTPCNKNVSIVPGQSQPSISSTSIHSDKGSVEVVGNVVERRRTASSRRRCVPGNSITSHLSGSGNRMKTPVNGFPPLQQRHIGTFLLPGTEMNSSSRKFSTAVSNRMPDNAACKNASLPILEQTSRESEALLQQMSIDEIRESIQELHEVLKPETIRFLRQRGSRQNAKPSEEPQQHQLMSPREPPVDVSKAIVSPGPGATESYPTTCNINSDKHMKEEMATLMSSIQTYEDLDDAYDSYYKTQTNGETSESLFFSIEDEYNDDEKFQLACKLLRSSSPQQTIWAARAVCTRLKYEFERNPSAYSLKPIIHSESDMIHKKASDWPFPAFLPVSLRCLLDAQSALSLCGNGGILLTTYVLQSLLLLLQLRACSDHVVYIPSEQKRDFYQADLLDDAVPSIPCRHCYVDAIAEPVNSPRTESALNGTPTSASVDEVAMSKGAYWTSSSTSTSAMADGQAFLFDPMWTLLSRMRIIPRLAEILQMFRYGSLLPIEALTSICGILAMIGLRSPGAASAIIHHPTLIDDLLEKMIVRHNNSARYDSRSSIPFVYLLCSLARQSRVVAEGIYRRIATENSPVLLHLLAPASNYETRDNSTSDRSDQAYFTLQQWTLILWRTLLRYGLSLDVLPTILTFSARHLTLGLVHASESSTLAPEIYSCFAVILCNTSLQTNRLLENEYNSLGSSYRMVSLPWQRQAVFHLQKIVDFDNFCSNREAIRLARGIFLFWEASLSSVAKLIAAKEAMEDLVDAFVANLKLLIPALDATVRIIGKSSMFSIALCFVHNPDFRNDSPMDLLSLNAATNAAAFVEALVCLISRIKEFAVISTSNNLLGDVNDLENKLAGLLLHEIDKHSARCFDFRSLDEQPIETMHRYRFNLMQARIVSFLFCGDFGSKLSVLKSMAFAVIGRLSVGEEFTAFVLFRIPQLFRQSITNVASSDSSLISEVLCRELIITEANHVQFEHSCNLNVDSSMFNNLKDRLVLQSLLVYAERGTKPGYTDSLHFLPVGKFWLWKLLSGSGKDSEGDETMKVMDTVLKIIIELESDASCYSMNLNSGPKLYYLANVFLNGRVIVSQDRIVSQIEQLFNLYFSCLKPPDLLCFAEECRSHSKLTPVGCEGKKFTSTNEKDFEAVLYPQERDSFGFSTNHISALDTFVGDFCDAYLEFGFHFPSFTKCLRLFLVHGFPTKVRCSIVHRLRGDLHLFTLQDEQESIFTLLPRFLSGGLPSFDQSSRDDPILIDCAASIYVRGSVCRTDDLFLKSWAICILTRSLAISIVTRNSSSLLVSKRRILCLDSSIATQVVLATAVWLSSDGSVSSLVSSALANDSQRRKEISEEIRSIHLEVTDWDEIVRLLTAVSSIKDYVASDSKSEMQNQSPV